MARLFVYGTLQPGGPNEHVLSDIAGEWHSASVKGHLHKHGWGAVQGYPALVLDESGDDIRGSVLMSSDLDDKWDELDRFEGEEYSRVVAAVTLANGEMIEAHMYVLRES